MIKVSTTGMVVSLKTDLRFPIPGQQGHGGRIIQIPIITVTERKPRCFLQVQIPEMGVRTFFWTVSTPVTSVIVKQTFFLKIAVACKYLISKDWLCLAIEL